MRLDENTIRRNEKIYTFLGAYFFFMAVRMTASFFGVLTGGPITPIITVSTSGILFLVATVLGICMSRSRIFHNRSIAIFFLGLCVWLLWGLINVFLGITLSSFSVLREFVALISFLAIVFVGSEIAVKYHLRKQLIRIVLLTFGTTLLIAYIVRFDGFAFIGSITKIFTVAERYRYSYGLGHVNTTGKYCFYFFALKAIYNCEEKRGRRKSDSYSMYFSMISPIVAVMLLSTASRASITSLIVFWLSYHFLSLYKKTGTLTKIMFILVTLLLMGIIIISVNWELVYIMSQRGINFIALNALDSGYGWISGVGFLHGDPLYKIIGINLLDNFYLLILLQSGIVGFVIFFGSISYFAYSYFRDINTMTKLHTLIGSFFLALIYYGMFEGLLFGHHGETDLISWILFITTLDERDCKTSRQQRNLLHNS